VPRHGQDLVVIGAALDHHVDLDVRSPACCAASMPASTSATGKSTSFMRRNRVVQPVQADGHALQAGVFQHLGLAAQQRAVGGQRQVQRLAIGRAQLGQLGDQGFDVLAQQRLAAGQAQLAHAMGTNTCARRVISSKLSRAVRQVLVVLVEHSLGMQ
jgi:hypothetical protein